MKMIIGTGIDITELERIEKMVQRQSAFITRILTKMKENAMKSYQADVRSNF